MIDSFDNALTIELGRYCEKKGDTHMVWKQLFPDFKPYGYEYTVSLSLIKRKYGVGTELSAGNKRSIDDFPRAKKLKVESA